MSPYYKYKKEKFIEKYKNAVENLELLREAILEYEKSNNKLIRRAMFAFFQDFTEYIIDMCETYLVINDIKFGNANSGVKLVDKASEEGFFDKELKGYLSMCVKLRNRYTHDYYDREESEKAIEGFCFNKIVNLDIFLEKSKEKIILKYKISDKKDRS